MAMCSSTSYQQVSLSHSQTLFILSVLLFPLHFLCIFTVAGLLPGSPLASISSDAYLQNNAIDQHFTLTQCLYETQTKQDSFKSSLNARLWILLFVILD